MFKDFLVIGAMALFTLLLLLFSVNLEHSFDKKCRDAGGVPSSREFKCFNPSSLIRLE